MYILVSRKLFWTSSFATGWCKRNCWELKTNLFRMLKIWTRERTDLFSWWNNRCCSSAEPLIGKWWRGRNSTCTFIMWIFRGFTYTSCRLPLLFFFRFLEKKINPQICKWLKVETTSSNLNSWYENLTSK